MDEQSTYEMHRSLGGCLGALVAGVVAFYVPVLLSAGLNTLLGYSNRELDGYGCAGAGVGLLLIVPCAIVGRKYSQYLVECRAQEKRRDIGFPVIDPHDAPPGADPQSGADEQEDGDANDSSGG